MKFNLWTTLFQIVNFIVLFAVLRRILYRPVREIMEKRRGAIERNMRDAERMQAEARDLKARCREELDGLAAQKARMVEAMQQEVSGERARLLGKVREEAEGTLARERALLSAERRAVAAEVREQVLDSVSVFSANLLRDLADEALHGAAVRRFLKDAERALAEQPPGAGGAERLAVEVAAAYPLSATELDAIGSVVRSRTAREIAVTVTVDRALIAGVRLKAGDRVIDGSLAGQVRAFRERVQ